MGSERLLSIVIPVFRSESALAGTVGELLDFFEGREAIEVVLVNDGSPDDVQRVIEDLCNTSPRVRGLELGRNLGQHRATLLGFAQTRGDVVVTLDDDGQNPPSAAAAVAEALRADDLDVVYGSFDVPRQSLARRAASAMNRWLSRHTLGNTRNVGISNVRALRGDLARCLSRAKSPYPYIDAMIFRVASRIETVTVEHRRRSSGSSTYTLQKLVALWLSHLTSLSVLPLRVAMFGSFGISALGFLGGVVAAARALYLGGAPVGWLSLFCAITFLFSVLFAFLGIVSAYLGRLYVSANEQDLVWIRSGTPLPTGEKGSS